MFNELMHGLSVATPCVSHLLRLQLKKFKTITKNPEGPLRQIFVLASVKNHSLNSYLRTIDGGKSLQQPSERCREPEEEEKRSTHIESNQSTGTRVARQKNRKR